MLHTQYLFVKVFVVVSSEKPSISSQPSLFLINICYFDSKLNIYLAVFKMKLIIVPCSFRKNVKVFEKIQ